MKISLVMATVDRSDEPARFLQHLNEQTYHDFELIVVDQNQDDRLVSILAPYEGLFPIIHVRTGQRGAARARNLGLLHISGQIVGFPDDDCWYDPEVLQKVSQFFARYTEWAGLSGRAVDIQGKSVAMRFDRQAGMINRYNAWHRGTTFTMFFRYSTIAVYGGFDEELGVGSGTPWGSGEETDYLIKLADQEVRVYYDPGFHVFHPDPLQSSPAKLLQRAGSYGQGLGKVIRKNNYPRWFMLYYLLRAVGGGGVSLAKRDWLQVRCYRECFRGRLYGWRKGRDPQ